MSLTGLRKQYCKINQILSETVGTAQPTALDEVYSKMEKDIDATQDLITAFVTGVNEHLQPNPSTRAKKAAVGSLSRVSCTPKKCLYSQTEGVLATTLNNYGTKLGSNSELGHALLDVADTYRLMADFKYQLEDTIKQNVIDPLLHLQNNEIKAINQQRAKVRSKRREYDFMKRSQRGDETMQRIEEKLEESKKETEKAMFNVISNDVEQVSQLFALVDAQIDFHRKTTAVLEELHTMLSNRIDAMSSRPRVEHIPARVLACRTARSVSALPSTNLNTAPSIVISDPVSHSSMFEVRATQQTYPKEDTLIEIATENPPPAQKYLSSNPLLNPSSEFFQTAPYSCMNPASQNDRPITISLIDIPSRESLPEPSSNQKPFPDYSLLEDIVLAPEPCCRALFDFVSNNPEDLQFKHGDLIRLLKKIDDNWYEGLLNGKKGLLPANFIQIVVPFDSLPEMHSLQP